MSFWMLSTLSVLGRIALAVLFGIQMFLQLLFLGVRNDMHFVQWWFVAAGILITFVGMIAIHELGHLIAGRAVGLQFDRFEDGGLAIAREQSGLRLRRNPARSREDDFRGLFVIANQMN